MCVVRQAHHEGDWCFAGSHILQECSNSTFPIGLAARHLPHGELVEPRTISLQQAYSALPSHVAENKACGAFGLLGHPMQGYRFSHGPAILLSALYRPGAVPASGAAANGHLHHHKTNKRGSHMKTLLMSSVMAFALMGAAGTASAAECGDVTIASMNWQSDSSTGICNSSCYGLPNPPSRVS